MDNTELKEFLTEHAEANNNLMLEKLNGIHFQLKTIVEQTTKTNGRVTRLEEVTRGMESFKETHFLSCPLRKDLENYKEQMRNDFLLWAVIRKYPKVSTILAVVLILLLVASGLHGVVGGLLGI